MRTISLIIGQETHSYTGPSTWSEVPHETAFKLFRVVKAGLTKKFMLLVVPTLVYQIPMDTMKMLLNARRSFRKYAVEGDQENFESLALIADQILESCKWIYSDPPPSTWLLKHFKANGWKLKPPADRLEDMTYEEFIFADNYSRTDPAKLCALLYRRRSKFRIFGFSGPNFHHDDIYRYDWYFRAIAFNDVRNMIAWNFVGMVQHLNKSFPQIFEKSAGGSTTGPETPTDWLEIGMNFCDNDAIRFDAMAKKGLYFALKLIQNRIIKNKEIESQYKK